MRVSDCNNHRKLFKSDGTPQRREIMSQLAPPIVVSEFDCVAAAMAGMSFLLQGGPGTGNSTRAKEVVQAVSKKKQVYVISCTNCAVANMRTETQRVAYMTVDRFLKQVLHRNLLRTPCLVLWDEILRPSVARGRGTRRSV